jgi:hypothetical protein
MKMNIVSTQDLFFAFDDEAVRAMGAGFDQACRSLRHFAHFERVRELVAKRIIEAAKNGERDPIRLHWQAVMGFSLDDVSMPVDSVRRNLPRPGLRADRATRVIAESPVAPQWGSPSGDQGLLRQRMSPEIAHRALASRIHVRNAAENGRTRTDANDPNLT